MSRHERFVDLVEENRRLRAHSNMTQPALFSRRPLKAGCWIGPLLCSYETVMSHSCNPHSSNELNINAYQASTNCLGPIGLMIFPT